MHASGEEVRGDLPSDGLEERARSRPATTFSRGSAPFRSDGSEDPPLRTRHYICNCHGSPDPPLHFPVGRHGHYIS